MPRVPIPLRPLRPLRKSGIFDERSDSQDGALIKVPSQNLQPYRQAGLSVAAWDANSRNARQICGDGVNVGQVHGERVVGFFAQLEGRSRRGGVTMASTFWKAWSKSRVSRVRTRWAFR